MDHPPSDEDTLVAEPVGATNSKSKLAPRHFDRGDEVGRYVILERVGVGGMGVVYAAWDPKLDRKVALKLLHGDKQAHGKRLIREAHAMARLAHPNVVTVYDADEVDERVFVAMEFVEGRTLSEWAQLSRTRAQGGSSADLVERDWSEILEVLLAAGRGLAAAHAQGLVHRDFKPDNVMIDNGGRVRVMDFGLVREAGNGEGATVEEEGDDGDGDGDGDEVPLEQRPHMHMQLEASTAFEQLTLAGALLGTPAYMAPEQLRGEAAGARADQFSFCVVAWQCLYGARPFAGDTPLALMFAITQGMFNEGQAGRAVPTRIRRVLERGLAPDPAARWPDMPSLLTALADDPRARRRPWLLAAASLAVAFTAGLAAVLHEPVIEEPPCVHAGEELDAWWSSARADELAAAFDRSELVYADESWTLVHAGLDRWASSWVAARRDACEATEVRREQSPDLLDLRMDCLDQRMHGFRALVEVLASADDTVIEKAVEAVEALPTLAVCEDRSWLTAAVRPPEDPELAAAVEAVRERVARANALTDGGKPGDALPIATAAEAEARQLDWQPLVAEAATALGRVHMELGAFAESRAALEAGYFAARRSGHDEITVSAAFRLIYTHSLGLGEFEAADRWAAHGLAEAQRVGRPELLAELESSIGIHSYMQGKHAEAAQAFARALALQADQPPGFELATAHINHGTVLIHVDAGRREEALAELARGLDMMTAALGGRHPSVAVALNNYATVLGQLDDGEGAIALLERALTINRDALGEDHPMTALVELNLSANLSKRTTRPDAERRYTRALELAEHSLAVHTAVFGDRHTRVAESQKAIARALLRLGRADAALARVEIALELWRATFGDAHEKVYATQLVRAQIQAARGQTDEAISMLDGLLGHADALETSMRIDVWLELVSQLLEHDPRRARELLAADGQTIARDALPTQAARLSSLRQRSAATADPPK